MCIYFDAIFELAISQGKYFAFHLAALQVASVSGSWREAKMPVKLGSRNEGEVL